MPTAEITHLPLRNRPPSQRLRKWLREVGPQIRRVFDGLRTPEQPVRTAGEAAATPSLQPSAPLDDGVLPFPIRGEALLANLAMALRARFDRSGVGDDPLLFTISRGPARLTIDRIAHVEFQEDRGAFHLAVEAGPDTTLLLETTDIEILVGFVMRYLDEKLAERKTVEAAS
jgi:hypothetical protein